MPLSVAQKSIITASIPFLETNGVELTAKFYGYMLETHPEVRPFFNKSHQITKKQPKILAFALLKYAENINDLTPLTSFVRQIVEKHVGLQVTPDQYNIVGSCLLKTLSEMLGEAATPEFLEAWEIAYFDLANVLIGLEKDRYDLELKIDNAWLGFKDAKVERLVNESDNVKSVYIRANDNKYAKFYPGQYITIRLSTDGGETVQSREYSLSNEFTELETGLKYYRISVRRIEGGLLSNYIHDTLKVNDDIKISSPYGKLLEPYIKSLEDSKSTLPSKSVVFFVGGIGITPSVSSVEYFLHQGNPVKLLLSNHNLKTRSFGPWLTRLLNQYKEILQVEEFISSDLTPVEKEKLPVTLPNYKLINHRLHENDLKFINKDNIKDSQYYLVGPLEYMKLITGVLTGNGVIAEDINSEQYGPVAV